MVYLVRNGIFDDVRYVDGAQQLVACLLKCDCLGGRYFQHGHAYVARIKVKNDENDGQIDRQMR